MPRILFLNACDDHLPHTLQNHGFTCTFDLTSTYAELADQIADYHGIVLRSRLPLDAALLDRADNLQFIARLGVGLEHVDLTRAEALGVAVLNSPEGSRDAVAEHTLGLLLGLLRHIPRADREIRAGTWDRTRNTGHEIRGKTVGIMGFGNMGSALAERLSVFGCDILAYDRYREHFGNTFVRAVPLETLWERTDILSLHFPISPANRYFVDAAFLEKFHKPIWLVNTARGEILETAAVVAGLKNNRIRGAALDVLEYEEGSFANFRFDALPDDFRFLTTSDRVLLTPHLGGITHEATVNHAYVLAEKILRLYGRTS